MAEVWHAYDVSLEDYFSRHGFNDGADSGYGWDLIKKAKEIINKHLEPFGLIVDEDDCPTDYNGCQLCFREDEFNGIDGFEMQDENLWEEALELEEQQRVLEGRLTKVNKPQIAKRASEIVKAIKAAMSEFDREASDDMAKVLRATSEELPLLVGHVEDEIAKNILEWRLKAA